MKKITEEKKKFLLGSLILEEMIKIEKEIFSLSEKLEEKRKQYKHPQLMNEISKIDSYIDRKEEELQALECCLIEEIYSSINTSNLKLILLFIKSLFEKKGLISNDLSSDKCLLFLDTFEERLSDVSIFKEPASLLRECLNRRIDYKSSGFIVGGDKEINQEKEFSKGLELALVNLF